VVSLGGSSSHVRISASSLRSCSSLLNVPSGRVLFAGGQMTFRYNSEPGARLEARTSALPECSSRSSRVIPLQDTAFNARKAI